MGLAINDKGRFRMLFRFNDALRHRRNLHGTINVINMKGLMYPLVIFAIAACSAGCASPENRQLDSNQVDSALNSDSIRKRLGADENGMKHYVFAYLKKGPNRNQDDSTAKALQSAHMNNIVRMADEGKLVVVGPFMDDTDVRGIYIFNTPSLDSAAAWTNTDPAIMAGRLLMDLHPWYGSAALMEVNTIHKTMQNEDITAK